MQPDTGPPLTGPRFFPAEVVPDKPQRERKLRIDADNIEEFEHEVWDPRTCPWTGEPQPWAKPYNGKVIGPSIKFDETHARQWARSAANARHRALDLAEGVGLLGDPEDIYAYSVAKAGVNDDRRRPLVWEEDFCLIYTEPSNGYASFGQNPPPADCRFVPRQAAIIEFGSRWHEYQHFGAVPT